MKYWFVGLALAAAFVLMAPSTHVRADREGGDSDSGAVRKGGGSGVPELDATAAGGAMVLALGGAAYLVSRRRKNEAA